MTFHLATYKDFNLANQQSAETALCMKTEGSARTCSARLGDIHLYIGLIQSEAIRDNNEIDYLA